ncbi:MAG TPA: M1 family aminopeptidase [Candidatus Acidoferrales bacterium]|nr:M1 family aminopeptidase [Candidatus Acidoferrales bacterium]
MGTDSCLNRARIRSIGAAATSLLTLLISVCLCNCAVPIAPGYKITNESREVRFVPGSPPAIRTRLTYTLVNSGTTELNFVDVTLPLMSSYGLADVHATLDGRAVQLQDLPAELRFDSPNALRLNFKSPWKRGAKHDLVIEYAFRSPSEPGTRITLSNSDFHIGSRGGFAALQPPKHLLAGYPKRPSKMDYTVDVPPDFRVLARGTPAGRKQMGRDAEYRYRLVSNDLAPFIVAGRYVESAPLGATGPIFWTFQPLSIQMDAAKQIAAAWETLEKDYGPLDKNIRVPHIIESAGLPEHVIGEEGPAAVSFPGGALVDAAGFQQSTQEGAQSEAFVDAVSHALAHNWFGDEIYPAANTSLVLTEGLPEYATIVIDEARGGEAVRRNHIQQYLSEYDVALKEGTEETLAVASVTDPEPERRIALAKAPLFFAALEDECGTTAMQSALKEVVTLLRGEQVGYPTIRAALEQESGKSLAATFRLWLNEKGIPQDFRARYGENETNSGAE